MYKLFIVLFIVIFRASHVMAEVPVQSRELQLVWVTDGYQVGIDNDPAWHWTYKENSEVGLLSVVTPDYYYPPASVNIRLHRNVDSTQNERVFRNIAYYAIETVLREFDVNVVLNKEDLQRVEYSFLQGYAYRFQSAPDSVAEDHYIAIVRNSTGQVFSLQATTNAEKLNHLMPAIVRMWNNIRFVTSE